MVVNSNKVSKVSTYNVTSIPVDSTYNYANAVKINISLIQKRLRSYNFFYQNIRGLNNNKTEELLIQWTTQFPRILGITEHHLKESELNNIHIEHYTMGASYCRKSRTHGGVGIFVYNTLLYSTVNLNKVCNDYAFEACVIKLLISSNIYFILCIYRPPPRWVILQHSYYTLSQF